jgi:hypothetical protein
MNVPMQKIGTSKNDQIIHVPKEDFGNEEIYNL